MTAEAADTAVDSVEIQGDWPRWVDSRLLHLAEWVEVVASEVVLAVVLEKDWVEPSAEAVVLALEVMDLPAASVASMEVDAVVD